MTVGEFKGKSLGVVDLLIEAIEVHVIVTAALHLCEIKAFLFGTHIIDINDLGIILGELASDRSGDSIRSIY